MKPVDEKIHRILAPRLIVLIGTESQDGRKNIIPINNITSVSTEPGMCLIAVYHPWITANNLKTAKGFTISVPSKEHAELVWKMGQKYSGYQSKDKMGEFKNQLDLGFSNYGPVLKDALGWIECEIVDRPNENGGNHLLVVGKYLRALINDKYYNKEISPIGNPEPIMQWESNKLAAAGDIFEMKYYSGARP